MALTVTHAKVDNIAAWTQADLNAQIALGNYPPGTTLADIVLSTDWNNAHIVTGVLDPANGGTGASSSFTAGSIIFSNGTSLTEDNPNLFWDNTNNRLGIGTNAPAAAFEVVTSGSGEARFRNTTNTTYTSFRFLNDQNTDFFSVIFGYSGSNAFAPVNNPGSVKQAGFLLTATTDPLILATDGTTRIYIAPGSSAGTQAETQIGIGTSAPTAILHLRAGGTTAGRAPLKFTSGSLNTTAEAGAVEFLTDKWYATITTAAARKEITLNDAALTSGRVPFATTNGRLNDSANLAYTSGTGLLVSDNVKMTTAGNALYVKEGTNGFQGSVTMVAGVATVTITGLTAADHAFINLSVTGGTLGNRVKAVCAANTLTITSTNLAGVTNTLETSTYDYFITRPA